MKIFQDWKAQKLFDNTYEKLSPQKQETLGEMIRELAERKIESEEGEYKEFYITASDVRDIAGSIILLPKIK